MLRVGVGWGAGEGIGQGGGRAWSQRQPTCGGGPLPLLPCARGVLPLGLRLRDSDGGAPLGGIDSEGQVLVCSLLERLLKLVRLERRLRGLGLGLGLG